MDPYQLKQVIRGVCPSKSNCYIIVTFKGKDGKISPSLAKTKAMKDYENNFYIQCNLYRNANIEGYFEFHMHVFYPSERADLDNSTKVVLDCLQHVKAIKNDNKCVKLVIDKFKDASDPRIEFQIIPV